MLTRFHHRYFLHSRLPACAVLLVAMLCLLFPNNAFASRTELRSEDKKHAESAFYFAKRDNWRDAILHAAKAHNPILRDYISWLALRDWDAKFSFSAFDAFLARHPDWPDRNRLIFRAEDRLFSGLDDVPLAKRMRWFVSYPPITGKGKLAYVEALMQRYEGATPPEEVSTLIRQAWRDGDFERAQEKQILQKYRRYLRREDHIARVDRLIWEGKTEAAARGFFAVPKDYQALFEARIRLQNNKPRVNNAIARVPKALQSNAGLIYERMKWRERKGLTSGVIEMLLAAPHKIPYAGKWWPTRHRYVREAIEKRQYSYAMKLLQNHGQTDGVGQADALWLMGWINLEYLKRPEQALLHFMEMEDAVSYPVSKARGAYWVGRAATALGKEDEARTAYARAAAYPTTFYGQLAAQNIHHRALLRLPAVGSPTTSQQHQFEQDARVRVVYMLSEMDKHDDARSFIRHMMEEASTQSQALMVARLGVAIGKRDYGVQASKTALRQHIALPETGYPHYQLLFPAPIEPPFIWAITRQESLFDPYAQSRSGARGLMQLMPGTAREVARKIGHRYSRDRLNDATYNLRLGSHYLQQLIDQFEGSYVLSIASYNAGPGRVRQWVNTYGYPGKSPEAVINWIERIPYSETRNYVQRVLENLQVYRAVLDPRNGREIRLSQDLLRGAHAQ